MQKLRVIIYYLLLIIFGVFVVDTFGQIIALVAILMLDWLILETVYVSPLNKKIDELRKKLSDK